MIMIKWDEGHGPSEGGRPGWPLERWVATRAIIEMEGQEGHYRGRRPQRSL